MEGCLEAWKEVGLTALRSTLDEQALDIAQRRELSTKRRKQLAHTTRAFKKAPEQERAQGMNAILKAYQEEIDSLTKRAKAAEAAFTGLYAKVREAPDPVAPLQAAVEIEPETVSLREQNDAMQSDLLRLRLDLKDYEQETAGIKNQDAVIRQLRDKIVTLEKQYEEDMNDMYRAEQDQREKQENDELRLQLQESKIEAQSLRAQLGVATASAAEARQAHDASEADLLDKDSQVGALERAKEAETEFVEGELRRARATIAGLEQELGHLRSRVRACFGCLLRLLARRA
jgi:homeobox protein cut-like